MAETDWRVCVPTDGVHYGVQTANTSGPQYSGSYVSRHQLFITTALGISQRRRPKVAI